MAIPGGSIRTSGYDLSKQFLSSDEKAFVLLSTRFDIIANISHFEYYAATPGGIIFEVRN